MLSSPLESLMLSLGAVAITNLMLFLLGSLFITSIVLRKKNKAHGFTQYTPTLLTTLGILGTFAGIIAGLLTFDITDIDGSIGSLLDGLKTAFLTSLVGMTLSIAYRLLQNSGVLATLTADGIDEEEIGAAELYAIMQQQAQGIDKLGMAIGGDDRDSLTSQMKLFRSDVKDQHSALAKITESGATSLSSILETSDKQAAKFDAFEERLWIKMQDFADMMSKSATEQVISALKEVITDFNNNLTEQFGENFKQLNEAVLKLVEWQDNYKQQLGQMTEQYAQGVTAITETEKSVSNISEESKAIPKSMQDLQQVMEVNQHQLKELEQHLDAFKDVRDRAVEALPEIKNHIDTAVDGMKTATETMTKGINESSESLKTAIIQGAEDFVTNSNKVNESLQGTSDHLVKNSEEINTNLKDASQESNSVLRDMVAGLKEESAKLNTEFRASGEVAIQEAIRIRENFEQGVEAMRSNLSKSLSDLAEQQQKESQRILAGMSNIAEKALSNTGEAVEKQVGALDTAMQHELEKVMNEMGRALASISGRFTSDYQALTKQMQNITRMAAEA